MRQHFVTLCTHQRKPVFVSDEEVELTRSQFLQQSEREGVEVTAYCFMPDHIHALLTGRHQAADVYRYVCRAKQHAGFAFSRRSTGRLWQEGYFDRALRGDETAATVIRYIINNPIRAGLVSSPAEYPHWGSGVWSRDEILEFIRAECP